VVAIEICFIDSEDVLLAKRVWLHNNQTQDILPEVSSTGPKTNKKVQLTLRVMHDSDACLKAQVQTKSKLTDSSMAVPNILFIFYSAQKASRIVYSYSAE